MVVLLTGKEDRNPDTRKKESFSESKEEALRDGYYWLVTEFRNPSDETVRTHKTLVTARTGNIIASLTFPSSIGRAAELRTRICPMLKYVESEGNIFSIEQSACDLGNENPLSPEVTFRLFPNSK